VDELETHYIDEEARAEHESIDRALLGVFGRKTDNQIVSTTIDGALMIVSAGCDTQPPVYYVYDREHQRMTRLLVERPDIPAEHLVPMQRVSYTTRDGLEIAAYLTVPKDAETRKLPVIVLPHGGPWARDWKRYDPEVQLFANRGFAVFQMNFRGSTGYGSAFHRKGYREWGQAIQDDITDGVKWLIEQGIADPDRIGIYGASFGGYAAMLGLAKTPDLYRAGASYAGVMDIKTMISDDRRYEWLVAWHKPMVGGSSGDDKRLKRHSPVRRASKIRVPVLLAHGADDQRVHVKHSRRMAKALRDSGADVEFLEFEDEIHGFLLERSRVQFYEQLLAFFERNLASRAPTPDGKTPAGERINGE
jgi:dipeptidyl aminopeptidase/acylaminoacyl peptidase